MLNNLTKYRLQIIRASGPKGPGRCIRGLAEPQGGSPGAPICSQDARRGYSAQQGAGGSLEPRPSPDQDSNEESRSYLLRLARLLLFLLPASWAVPGLGYAG